MYDGTQSFHKNFMTQAVILPKLKCMSFSYFENMADA